MIHRSLFRVVDAVRRAAPRRACLLAAFCLLSMPGCSTTAPSETNENDPLAEWTSRARPEAENDRATGWSDKARETERRLGFR